MKCIFFKLVLLAYNLCFGEDVIHAVLNIRNYENVAEKADHAFYRLPHHSLRPLPNVIIDSIVDGDKIIWPGNDGRNPVRAVHLMYSGDEYKLISVTRVRQGLDGCDYYELIDDVWTPIDSRQYFVRQRHIADYIDLDIAKARSDINREVKKTKFGNSITTFLPHPFMKIIEITDGEESVWKGEVDGLYTTTVTLHTRRNELKLLNFSVLVYFSCRFSYLHYYEKKDGKWHEIEYDEYERKSKRIERESRLDISSPIRADPFYYDFMYDDKQGTVSVTFTPKKHTYTTEVYENDLLIWNSKKDSELCAYLTLHFRNYNPILALVHADDGEFHGDVFFEKKEDKWSEIEYNVYYELLEKFDKEEEEVRRETDKNLRLNLYD